MNADFLDACERHWADAEILFAKQRWANADHLYGFSAECGLKYLMVRFGMVVDPTGSPKEWDDKKHANEIWQRYATYCSGPEAAAYVLPNTNPFDDWKVSQRYAHQSQFDEARAQKHKAGADDVRELTKKAQS